MTLDTPLKLFAPDLELFPTDNDDADEFFGADTPSKKKQCPYFKLLEVHAEAIDRLRSEYRKQTGYFVMQVGKEVYEAYHKLPNKGRFSKYGKWVRRRLGVTRRCADNWKRAYEHFNVGLPQEFNWENFSQFDVCALYELSKEQTPYPIVQEARAMAERGERVRLKWVRDQLSPKHADDDDSDNDGDSDTTTDKELREILLRRLSRLRADAESWLETPALAQKFLELAKDDLDAIELLGDWEPVPFDDDLTRADVPEIKWRHKEFIRRIGKEFGVGMRRICSIVNVSRDSL